MAKCNQLTPLPFKGLRAFKTTLWMSWSLSWSWVIWSS